MSELRDLINETIREELPALVRGAVAVALAEQSQAALEREIELLFKHNADVGEVVRRAVDVATDSIAEGIITRKVADNLAVREALADFCCSQLSADDGALANMMSAVQKTRGPHALSVIDLSPEDQVFLQRGLQLLQMLSREIMARFQAELRG